jgi:tRNA threonylcarbamoyladenosine biosynthesis protein TsaB
MPVQTILALETTEARGSAAAMADGRLLAELFLHPQQRSAQSLLPAVRALLEQVGWRPADVRLVAVTVGPGSFTGLRVGVTAAKTFAYAVGAEVLGMDTLEAIAAGLPAEIPSAAVAVDAQRGDVVAAAFRRDAEGWLRPDGPAALVNAQQWLAGLAAGTAVAGPVLGRLAERVPPHLTVLDAACWPPRAAQVARLAARDHAAGRRDDLWTLTPRYSRRAAAEEKLHASREL